MNGVWDGVLGCGGGNKGGCGGEWWRFGRGRRFCRKMTSGQVENGELQENGWSQVNKIDKGERDRCDV
jgi:hypothetical protein